MSEEAEESYVSVDVEASGPIPGDYSLLAIGACLVDDHDRTFYRELKPTSDRFVKEALRISNLSLEHLAEHGADPAYAMREFADWVRESVGSRLPVMVGFNAAFDWAFVNWYFLHYHIENPFGIGAVDIKSYYMGLAGTSWSDTRSSRIPETFRGAADKHTHHAVDDALEQAAMFRLMMAEARRR